ncbi:MAG: PilZ domain-containing protein [Smithella sp.]
MRKESLICFRTSKDLHESLAYIAKKSRRSLSSIIEMALTNYAKERKAFQGIANDKRQYPRRALSVPVVINIRESGQIAIGAIIDISLGGVRILIPRNFKYQIPIEDRGSRFEIVFSLSTEKQPLSLICESKRVIESEDGIYVGASFIDADFNSYKILQNYLM